MGVVVGTSIVAAGDVEEIGDAPAVEGLGEELGPEGIDVNTCGIDKLLDLLG